MDITAVSNMDFSTSILCFFSTWACLLVFTRIRRRVFPCKFPPGPFPLPIFGNLFELGNKPHESLAELAATYGPLMTLKLGSVTAIVVSSANMAKEVLQKHDQTFSGRTIPHAAQALNHHEVSMTWLPSSLQWRILRKICATQIFTAQRLNDNEGIRLTKVKDLIDHIREESKSKHTINIGQTVFSTILNMISNTLFSIDLAPYQSKSGGEFKAIGVGCERSGRVGMRSMIEEEGHSLLIANTPTDVVKLLQWRRRPILPSVFEIEELEAGGMATAEPTRGLQ
ncbi:hypothetical protein IFM89_029758 [Coptis chinensis]|uniref:Uncharacterized protein n=1 Tax=Coptis chinensis TaxID=261450 RepID=A0A835IF12_9MAGN|nr:hypothetical protein IFM89_029758 [Coptis chinensis]